MSEVGDATVISQNIRFIGIIYNNTKHLSGEVSTMLNIKTISASPNPSHPAVIFFHGLDGKSTQTWMENTEDEKTLWPRWLVDDFKCSVFLVDYDAKFSAKKDGVLPLPAQGDEVLEMLASEQALKGRKLILVGHSLGGLVIKAAIQHGLSEGVERFKQVINRIRGVVFIGTPHKGAQLVTLAKHFSPLLKKNAQANNVQRYDTQLSALNEQFLAYHNKLSAGKLSVLTFMETQGIFVGKKMLGFRMGPTVTVIEPDSTNPHVAGQITVPLEANHIGMCKLADKKESLYKSLLQFLKDDVDLSEVLVKTELTSKPSERVLAEA